MPQPHPITQPGEMACPVQLHKVDPVRLNKITRKLLRSKKLSNLLLFSRRARLRSISIQELPATHRGTETEVLSAEALNHQSFAFFDSDEASAMPIPCEDQVFPAITLTTVLHATVCGGSNRVIVGQHLVNHGFFRLASDLTLEEIQRTLRFDVRAGTAIKLIKDPNPLRFQTAACFTDAAAYNYAHWLTEVLPRIFLFMARHSPSAQRMPLIIDDGLHKNQMRSLEVVLTRPAEVYALPQHREAQVAELLHIGATGYVQIEPRHATDSDAPHGIISHAAMSGMVASIKDRLSIAAKPRLRNKLYVKRNSRHRNVINSDQLEHALVASGFKVIEPEKMSFDEQVEAFHSASFIMGATGAAMANIIFCQPDCRIFILIAKHPDMPYFYWQNIANGVGQKITYLLCDALTTARQDIHADFTVPIQRVEQILQQHDIT